MNNIEKITKGLEWHIRTSKAKECRYALVDCPYVEECKVVGSSKLLEDALNLINNQKEEIEYLKMKILSIKAERSI